VPGNYPFSTATVDLLSHPAIMNHTKSNDERSASGQAVSRVVAPEILDDLPAEDARALRSRRDLRRLNHLMGNPGILAAALAENGGTRPVSSIAELGAGDGWALSQVIRLLPPTVGRATLVDRQGPPASDSTRALESCGWKTEFAEADVFDWLAAADTHDAIVCNLFLHHFEGPDLIRLLKLAAGKCRLFVAAEPRRSRPALFFSRYLWLLGCSAVTQHDAVVSVRAGFCGDELGALWPLHTGWRLEEREANLANHLFVARREVFQAGQTE
jgi:hypothetical protein